MRLYVGTIVRFHFGSTARLHLGTTMPFHFGTTMRFHFGCTTRFHFGTAIRFHFGIHSALPFWEHYALPFWDHYDPLCAFIWVPVYASISFDNQFAFTYWEDPAIAEYVSNLKRSQSYRPRCVYFYHIYVPI